MNENANEFEFEELERNLESQLMENLDDLKNINLDRAKIGNPDALGNVVMDVVWEQFINQVGTVAGEEFVKENRNLPFDIRSSAHIQTGEHFQQASDNNAQIQNLRSRLDSLNSKIESEKGDKYATSINILEKNKLEYELSNLIATHNHETNLNTGESVDNLKKYDEWQSQFQHDDKGNVITHQTRSGKEEATLVSGARDRFDKDRPSGSVEKGTDMDHTVSAGEIIRDAEANVHLNHKQQEQFANSDTNLNEMDAAHNRSKGDKSMSDWLDYPNKNGQKPNEIYDIDEKLDKQYREKDTEAREAFEETKAEGRKDTEELGSKSADNEATRMGGKALKAVLMTLLAGLAKKIIQNLIFWFKAGKKNFDSFIESVKEAFSKFVKDLKENVFHTIKTAFTTIASAIFGPIVGIINKVFILLKQGYKSLKEAINYLRNPENKRKSLSIVIMEVSKILIAGLTAGGAIVLGEVIEKALLAVPGFQIPIPLLGTPASIIGIFAGAVVSGIIGAVALNLIDKVIAKKQLQNNTEQHVDKANEVLAIQEKLIIVSEAKIAQTSEEVNNSITERHTEAGNFMRKSFFNVMNNNKIIDNHNAQIESIDASVNDNSKAIENFTRETETINNSINSNSEHANENNHIVADISQTSKINSAYIDKISLQIEDNNIKQESKSNDNDFDSIFNSLNEL